jgi:hypothetical protein
MRNFKKLPAGGGAQGRKMVAPQDIPHTVITLHPSGGSIARATPAGAAADGAYEYAQPVKSVRAAQLHKAGKP